MIYRVIAMLNLVAFYDLGHMDALAARNGPAEQRSTGPLHVDGSSPLHINKKEVIPMG